LFLEVNGTGPHNLSQAEPPANGSVMLGRNDSVNFTIRNFSALARSDGDFHLNLSLVPLNSTGMQLWCSLYLDLRGNGSMIFQGSEPYNTTISGQREHVSLVLIVTGIEHPGDDDLLDGTVRLRLNRTDNSDGLLEVLCGNGQNSSLVSIPYGPPLQADAGADRTALVNRSVELNASELSRTVDPASTTYLWDLGNGHTATGPRATAVYPAPGIYTVVLSQGWRSFRSNDTVRINVTAGSPPVAEAGLNLTRNIGEPVTFRGGGYDPDGTIVSYNWSFGDGFSAAGQNVTHMYPSAGDYTAVLTVRDDSGAQGNDSLRVHINRPPRITNITADRNGNRVLFSAAANDTDGTLLTYRWDFGDGGNGTGQKPEHAYGAPGNYTATCVVTDEYGANSSASVKVGFSNMPPRIVKLGASATSVAPGENIQFDPVVQDPEGDTLLFLWDFGDGGQSTARAPSHSYSTAGTRTVTLRVSDGESTSTATVPITVSEGMAAPDPGTLGFMICVSVFALVAIIALVRLIARRPPGPPEPTQYPPVPPEPPAPQPPYAAPYGRAPPGYQAPRRPTFGRPPVEPPAPVERPAGPCRTCGSRKTFIRPDGRGECRNCKSVFHRG